MQAHAIAIDGREGLLGPMHPHEMSWAPAKGYGPRDIPTALSWHRHGDPSGVPFQYCHESLDLWHGSPWRSMMLHSTAWRAMNTAMTRHEVLADQGEWSQQGRRGKSQTILCAHCTRNLLQLVIVDATARLGLAQIYLNSGKQNG